MAPPKDDKVWVNPSIKVSVRCEICKWQGSAESLIEEPGGVGLVNRLCPGCKRILMVTGVTTIVEDEKPPDDRDDRDVGGKKHDDDSSKRFDIKPVGDRGGRG